MPQSPKPTDRLEELVLELGLPDVRVVDLGWGPIRRFKAHGETLRHLIDHCGISYTAPALGSCDSERRFRSVVASYIASRASSERLVLLLAKVTGDWKTREAILQAITRETDGVEYLCLSRAASQGDIDRAITELAELLSGERTEVAEATRIEEKKRIGDRVKEKSGIRDPVVLVVCGNERQQNAANQFPQKVREEFGIDGEWIFTDYDRPERVVARIRSLCHEFEIDGERTRLIAVIFSQKFNATHAKRDGMSLLRNRGILALSPHFKSLGSALREAEMAMRKYLGDEPSSV